MFAGVSSSALVGVAASPCGPRVTPSGWESMIGRSPDSTRAASPQAATSAASDSEPTAITATPLRVLATATIMPS
jgi:hypothetical protein